MSRSLDIVDASLGQVTSVYSNQPLTPADSATRSPRHCGPACTTVSSSGTQHAAEASTENTITAVQRGAPANPENCTTKLRSLAQPTHKHLHQGAVQPDSSQRVAARKDVRDTIQADHQQNATPPALRAHKGQHAASQRACRFGHQNDMRAYYTQPQPTAAREPIERPRRPIRFNAETKMNAKKSKQLVPPERRKAAGSKMHPQA